MRHAEIWLLEFPEGAGHEYIKQRPVLIIETNSQLRKTNLISIMPFTSRLTNRVNDDILITKNSENKLYRDSLLKVQHILSLDHSRFIKKIGVADEKLLDQVKTYLKKHFGI